MYDEAVKSDTCEAQVTQNEIDYMKAQRIVLKDSILTLELLRKNFHLEVFYEQKGETLRLAMVGEMVERRKQLKKDIARAKSQLKLQKIRKKQMKQFKKSTKEK